MRSTIRRAVVVLAALPLPLFAQGVTVETVSDVRFHGALAAMASIASRFGGGSLHDNVSTTYLSGHKLRMESENNGTIIDADEGRLTSIDHKQKTYTSMTFDEMAAMVKRAQESAQAKRAEVQPQAANDPKASKDEVHVKYRVSADRPGQHQQVAGYDAERMVLTITLEGEAKPEGGETQQVGSMVFLIDQWISKDPPQSAAWKEFQRAYAQKAGRAFQEQKQAMQAMLTADPRMKDGFEAAAKEMQKVQGTPLKSTTYVVLVPAEMQFDRQLALGDAAQNEKTAPEKKKGGFGGLVGRLKNAAEQANKPDESKSEAPKQGTVATFTEEVRSIKPGPVPAEMFAPPAGYREVKPPQR